MNKRVLLFILIVSFLANGCSCKEPKPALSVNEEQVTKPARMSNVPYLATSDTIDFSLTEKILVETEKEYGIPARQRLVEWEKLIRTDTSKTDMEKLKKVNIFFNKLAFIHDDTNWGQEDYWATPVEFLASNGGDCEDFSLAKYFTLLAMGVNKRRLYITYAKKLDADESHMVMTYYEVPGEKPLVLDNLTDDIILATQRTDLLPVYSINDTGLWKSQTRSKGLLVGKSEELNRWKEMLTRMPEGFQ